MLKDGLSLHELPRDIGDVQGGWSLCIGAGTSLPVFPNWEDLVKKLVCEDSSANADLATRLLEKYSPDALIEAAHARLGSSPAAFGEQLAAHLYADLKAKAGPQWPLLVRGLEHEAIGRLSLDEWKQFVAFFRDQYPCGVTGLVLAEVLLDTLGNEHSPNAILSFNAEPLLLGLVNGLFATQRHDWGSPATSQAPAQQFDKVTRSMSYRARGRIPYVFCHGLLRVPDSASHHVDSDSIDKLVFSEGQYLTLGNELVSWQAATFVEACFTRRLVFVGVSLSDPNMRAWLFRANRTRRRELAEINPAYDGGAPPHFWINKRPSTESEARWIEASVAHLGVRLVWLPEWSDAGTALRTLAGVR